MKVLMFGATGSIGRLLVEQVLEPEHMVTAFLRNPAKLDIQHQNLKIVQGDVTDAAAVERAMPGQEAVLAAIGSLPWKDIHARAEGNCHIIQAMEKAGVRRLVSLSTLGTEDSWKIIPLKYKILFRTLLRKVFEDHQVQES